jgi:hypothetical protein
VSATSKAFSMRDRISHEATKDHATHKNTSKNR